MLVSIETLKEYLGMPDVEDPVEDPILERSSMLAQSLVESYVGTTLEVSDANPKTDTRYQLQGVRTLRLNQYPAVLNSLKIDSVTVPAAEYTYSKSLGTVTFTEQRARIATVEVVYLPGFDYETFPPDLEAAIVNIALGIYENGGKITTQVSGGALKSLTMFDAMSMSFDTGAAVADSAGTPAGIVNQWAFILDKYRVDKYVMGQP